MATTPPSLPEGDGDLLAAHGAWIDQRLAALTGADGWLNLLDLVWLTPGRWTVGSDPACQVKLPAGPAFAGVLLVADRGTVWQDQDGRQQALADDSHGIIESVAIGRYRFNLIRREGRLALRVRDLLHPALSAFKGIRRWPFDPGWIIRARWDGTTARFCHEGRSITLTPQPGSDEQLLFVVADAAAGSDTYGGGRFLRASPSGARVMLDFNRAENPPCVFTPYATCPLAPPGNRLPFRVTAGERVPE